MPIPFVQPAAFKSPASLTGGPVGPARQATLRHAKGIGQTLPWCRVPVPPRCSRGPKQPLGAFERRSRISPRSGTPESFDRSALQVPYPSAKPEGPCNPESLGPEGLPFFHSSLITHHLPLTPDHYSYLSATFGSTFVTRRAAA